MNSHITHICLKIFVCHSMKNTWLEYPVPSVDFYFGKKISFSLHLFCLVCCVKAKLTTTHAMNLFHFSINQIKSGNFQFRELRTHQHPCKSCKRFLWAERDLAKGEAILKRSKIHINQKWTCASFNIHQSDNLLWSKVISTCLCR